MEHLHAGGPEGILFSEQKADDKETRRTQDALYIQKLKEHSEVTHIVDGESYPDQYDLRRKVEEEIDHLPEDVRMDAEILMMPLEGPFLYRNNDDRNPSNPLNPVNTKQYSAIKDDIMRKWGIDEATFFSSNKLESSTLANLIRYSIDMAQKLGYSDILDDLEKVRLQFNGYESMDAYKEDEKKGLVPHHQMFDLDKGYKYKSVLDDSEKIILAKKIEELAERLLLRAFEGK